jgi:hypothetical protein
LDQILPRDAFKYPSFLTRWFRGLCALNLDSLYVLLRNGPSATQSFLANCHRIYAGYGMPRSWERLPWRENLHAPTRGVQEIFPEIDFTHCPPLDFPISRDLGISTEELAILSKVAGYLQAKRVVEFGTAEGRTAVNLAMNLPDDGEVITLDLAPIPGQNEVGYFYWDHPSKSRIRQVFASVNDWDSRPYKSSADMVFADACDLMPGLGAEFFHAITVVKPGGVIFRHDYGSAVGTTIFWNWVADRLPVVHVAGTSLVCLRLNSEEIIQKAQSLLSEPLVRNTIKTTGGSE